jgi:predicted aspartyl protease
MFRKESKLIFDYNNNVNPPAPFLEISFLTPISQNLKSCIKSNAIIDSGASISVIPKRIAYELELKYIDEIKVKGFKGSESKSYVYPILITIKSLGNFITKVITWDEQYAIIGRDLLNKWLILLNGPDNNFEISLSKSQFLVK